MSRSNLKLTEPYAKPVNGLVALPAGDTQQLLLGGLGSPLQFGPFLTTVAVFLSLVASRTGGQRALLALLVDGNAMLRVAFAFRAVCRNRFLETSSQSHAAPNPTTRRIY